MSDTFIPTGGIDEDHICRILKVDKHGRAYVHPRYEILLWTQFVVSLVAITYCIFS